MGLRRHEPDRGFADGGDPHLNLAVRVQHHPSRAHLLPALLERLPFADVQVVADPGGSRPSSWRTHRACLEALPDAATHLLVVQDDALPCRQFAGRALATLAQQPGRIVCFFVPGFGHLSRRFHLAARQGFKVVDLPVTGFVPVVAVAYPAEVARAIPVYVDARRIPTNRADDAVIATYARAHRTPVAATVPCLVEHLDGEPSVMRMKHATGMPHRVAALYADTVT